MTDRPIIFSAPMVQAILDGRKTQTRRVLKPQPEFRFAVEARPHRMGWNWVKVPDSASPRPHERWPVATIKLPYVPGDRLWVREAFATDGPMVRYVATDHIHELRRKKPSIHMPRWASRLTLVVTDARVQRVQEISESDARAEGLATVTKDGRLWKWGIPDRDGLPGTDDHGWHWNSWQTDPREAFRVLWDSINADRGYGWSTNPWVVCLSFKTHRINIDRMERA